MKTKLFALALFSMSFTIGYGYGPVKIIKTSDPTIFNLTYMGNESANAVIVKVTDEQGNVLANRTVNSTKRFSLPLNFANQQFGKYFVTVNVGTQSETQEVDYGIESQISSYTTALPGVISHTSKLKSGQYLVSVPKDQTTTARITVFDADNNVLFTATKVATEGAAFLLNTKHVQGPTVIQVTDASSE